jgi:predicted nucleic acid-binding protein
MILALRLMDTDVASFVLKGHSLAARYRHHLQGHRLAVSFMTEGELYEWGLRAAWGRKRFARLDALLSGLDIIPSSADLDRRWGAIRFERRNQPIGVADAWIAATALVHGYELVTNNATDFQGIRGLRIITEASP